MGEDENEVLTVDVNVNTKSGAGKGAFATPEAFNVYAPHSL